MILNPDLINSSQELKKLASQLSQHKIIAIDTEFIRERTFAPQLALIQVATAEETWLVDPLTLSKTQLLPFFKVLTNPNILKVMHSSFGDQECLWATYETLATPSLDTYEAASLLGLGESVGLRELVYQILNIKIPKYLTRTHWHRRPLSEEMRKYAMADVQYLVEIAQIILKKLEALGRQDWAFELSTAFENAKLYSDQDQEITQRLARSGRLSPRSFNILKKLVAWREARAKKLDLPRKHIAHNETLMHIANAVPKTIEQLGKFRGINGGEIKHQGNIIISLIQAGLQEKPAHLAPPPKFKKPNPEQNSAIDFLGTFVKALGKNLKIASRLLITSKGLQKIVLEDLRDSTQWLDAKICNHHVQRLIGPELEAAIQGKRGLAIRQGKLQIVEMN